MGRNEGRPGGRFGFSGFKGMPAIPSQVEINHPGVVTLEHVDARLSAMALDLEKLRTRGMDSPWPAMIWERVDALLDLRLIFMWRSEMFGLEGTP